MAKVRGKPFVKGDGRVRKQKGDVGLIKREAKLLFQKVMAGQVNHIQEALEAVKKKNPAVYLNILSNFFPYFLPKKAETDEEGKTVKDQVFIVMGQEIHF
jgi:hypothetical protein